MLPYLSPSIPVVFLYNNIESFFDFLSRPEKTDLPRHQYIPNRQYSKGDRALLSLGNCKLAFVSAPVPHALELTRLGFTQTDFAYPLNPSPWLSLDILQEPPLLRRLVDYAGPTRTVQLVPYATTPQFWQLVEKLRADFGLTVLLPESPLPGSEWVKEYIDTKAGFRVFAGRWLPDADVLLPEGFACETMLQAAEAAYWFTQRGQTCLVKTDGGESGIGHHVFKPNSGATVASIFNELHADAYLHNDLIIVEEFIQSTQQLSPSLEVYVPPLGAGEPVITYLSNQLFLGFDFYGLVVSRELTQASWYPLLAEKGLVLARQLQAMGYAGHFDLDTVVDDNNRLYLLELNSRRTAGTHVHEFAYQYFGPDYLDRVVLLSVNKTKTGSLTTFDSLKAAISDLLFPINGENRGLIFAVSSILAASEFGCIIVAATQADVLALHQQLRERMDKYIGK